MIIVEINNQTRARISRKFVGDVIKSILKKLTLQQVRGVNIKKATVSVALVDERTIKRLNKCYRGKNEVTDVLSFEAGRSKEFVSASVDKNYLGEIIICYPRAKKQAEEFGHPVKEELKILLKHGLLHLLGYSHKEMERITQHVGL